MKHKQDDLAALIAALSEQNRALIQALACRLYDLEQFEGVERCSNSKNI